VDHARRRQGVFVSPISAWEVGLLSRPRPGREPLLRFDPDPEAWFARVMAAQGVKEARLTPRVAIAASWLPGEFHGDPGDRLIVATARELGVPVVTRARAVLDYALNRSLPAIAC